MTGSPAGPYLWWLVSRASGIVALVLVSLTVLLGLAMAARVVRGRRKPSVLRLHQHLTLVALAAIAGHGLALLGDQWLHPGPAGIAVPFVLPYRPLWTGMGIIAGYLAVLLGPSYHLRRRVGARTWRKLHRAIVLVWVLAAAHTLGSGSDSRTLWLRAIVALPAVGVVYLLTLRVLAPRRPGRAGAGPETGPHRRPAAAGVHPAGRSRTAEAYAGGRHH